MRRSPVSIIAALTHMAKRREPRGPMALIVAVVLAATIAACGSENIQPSAPPAVLANNDRIPPPPDLQGELAKLPAAWGFRLDEIPTGAPSPRISAEQATEVAGEDFLEELQANRMPPQNVSVPDGLLRRLYVNPEEGIRQTVWVVIYRWDRGFNCFSPAGGPGTCEQWTSKFVDDHTGEIVGGLGGGLPDEGRR